MIGLAVPEAVIGVPPPDGVAVTVYPVMVFPPVEEGGVNVRVTWPAPGARLTPVGAEGVV